MKIKRFVAKDMRTALTEVKEFLGPDAIILSNKKVAGGVEIVAAIDPEAAPVKAAPEAKAAAQPAAGARLNIKVDDEPEQVPADSLQALLARQISKQPAAAQAISANKMAAAKTAAATNALFSVANSAAPDVERQSSGAAAVNLNELTRYQEQQAKLMQKQFDAMRNEMSSMKQLLQHQVSGLMWQDLARREPVRAMVIEKLLDLGLSEPVADQIACFMPEDISDAEAWDSALELLTGQLITTNDDIMRRGGVVALVGPTGVGKTTTVAKLAAQFAKRHGADQVALITTDSFRIGAYEQLATFGRIIGCPVKQVKDSEELAMLLNQLQTRKLILIDTAGMSQRDVRLAEKLASLVHNSRVKIKSYLVLSATSQARVMQETVEHFKRIPLAGCIFTKLDECLSLGEIINVAIQNALPVSYLTHGQRVPEDIEMADAKTMVAKAEQLRTSNSSTGYQWYSDTTARVEGTYA
ncbi:MAG: flagellar biosynthesis protein FlhF [Gammaproteobacteria bacterium]|nr:flagellar biosynthesis protein FlhF [Gammaproteobacteria bacterium]MBU2058423.1 flagellar biosynthesis protein FlhF [Gammaproteobacteria bacterium]MBU2176524.1 flagellar biosynthesis protein FlhF [Gammaproteobacteria bacterium]MBU2248534.1 flagellar biosynthesis protein FlhF [Gammaproteobacteria bacterium]MBU2345603.1 flagellar biosynthesis protein FlhF [Gammaproteobacteria bacterium]